MAFADSVLDVYIPKHSGFGGISMADDLVAGQNLSTRDNSPTTNARRALDLADEALANPEGVHAFSKRANTVQPNAPREMTFISWPPGSEFASLQNQYVYDSR